MSLKENVNYIKEEISTQESFIENFFKLEKFYNKYKKVIISTISIIIIGVIGISVSNYIKEQNKLSANNSFNKCLENPTDKAALEELESQDENLYKLAVYMNDRTKEVDKEFLKELSIYSKAIENTDLAVIDKITQNQNFLLKDFALFNKAMIQVQNGKVDDAKTTLKLISTTSSVTSLVKMLEHYMLTK